MIAALNSPRGTKIKRQGFTLIELILFLGIFSIMIGTILAILIATQETRIRQQAIAEVEQRSAQITQTIIKAVHRAEAILTPANNQTGSMLSLQMSMNTEFPTIIASLESGSLLLIQKTTITPLLNTTIAVNHLQFQNINDTNVLFSFDLTAKIPLATAESYTRHVEMMTTLFPKNHSQSGGCGSCPVPTCVNKRAVWYHCALDICTPSPSSFPC